MIDRTFAQRLKAAVENSETITEAGLATKAGLSNSVVRKILKGTTQNPRVDTAIKICSALGTTLEDFMSGAFEAGQVSSDKEAVRIRHLLSQLSARERHLLITYGEGLRDAQDTTDEEQPQVD
jgi:transcriptional regulator with XRE-family HTH domain|tara:strand:- start:600 stop:968 length:369 start_codon:yes stop_codon:yes gene_type:complete